MSVITQKSTIVWISSFDVLFHRWTERPEVKPELLNWDVYYMRTKMQIALCGWRSAFGQVTTSLPGRIAVSNAQQIQIVSTGHGAPLRNHVRLGRVCRLRKSDWTLSGYPGLFSIGKPEPYLLNQSLL